MDNDLKMNAKTFASIYLVEQFEENVIVRSRNCGFMVSEEKPVCKHCMSLKNKDISK